MHGVSCKALTVNAMIAQHVAVKAVVVPDLLDAGILKELLENGKQLSVGFLHQKVQSDQCGRRQVLALHLLGVLQDMMTPDACRKKYVGQIYNQSNQSTRHEAERFWSMKKPLSSPCLHICFFVAHHHNDCTITPPTLTWH